jgi:hypothetical protein
MRKGDFSLEILVNNEVLPEYEVPLNEKTKLTRSREKENITYVAVPYSKSYHFCIRVGVHTTLGSMVYKGIHYVDGQNDDTYMELNPLNDDPYTYIYGFYNYDNTIFHKFKFDTNRWTDDEIFVSNLPKRCTAPCTKKDYGVISVYVFAAERLPGKRFMTQNKNIREEMAPEPPDLDNIDPKDIICLDEPQKEPMPNLRAISNKPVAELHIRYQTKEWLRNEGFNIIELSDSLISSPNTTFFEDHESDDELITSEEITDSTDYDRKDLPSIRSEEITDNTDDDSKNAKIDEEYPSSIISDICNNYEGLENVPNFEYGNKYEEEFGFKSLKEKDKIANESPNYRVTLENPNEQAEDKSLDKEAARRVERNFGYEAESMIIEVITEKKIKDAESAANERLNERIKEISINDKEEENRTFYNNKGEGREDLMVIDRNEFEKKREFIDLTVESPKEIIEISDDDGGGGGEDSVGGVILVETAKNFLTTSVNKKKHRSKKIKYYSDSSVDWNNDDSSDYSDSSSEDEFVSISKKRLRT